MEKLSQWQEKYGFGRSIDCGAVALRIFDEAHLERNVLSPQIETLAYNRFCSDELPNVTSSELSVSPSDNEDQRELHGDLVFELPTHYRLATAKSIMEELVEQLETTLYHHPADFEIDNNKLRIIKGSQLAITIELSLDRYAQSYLSVDTILDTTKSDSSLYQDVEYCSALWVRCHSFLAEASDLPYVAKPRELLVGSSDKMSPSDIELLVEHELTYDMPDKSHEPLGTWGDDIDSGLLAEYEKKLDSDVKLKMAAAQVLINKSPEINHKQPVIIMQADITTAMDEVQQRHRQSPDENNHRD